MSPLPPHTVAVSVGDTQMRQEAEGTRSPKVVDLFSMDVLQTLHRTNARTLLSFLVSHQCLEGGLALAVETMLQQGPPSDSSEEDSDEDTDEEEEEGGDNANDNA